MSIFIDYMRLYWNILAHTRFGKWYGCRWHGHSWTYTQPPWDSPEAWYCTRCGRVPKSG